MARSDIAAQIPTRDGVEPTFEAANVDGNMFDNDGHRWLYVKNGGGAAIAVTFDVATTVDGQTVTDRSVNIPAGEERIIGPFPADYNRLSGADEGKVYVDYDAVTSVTVALFGGVSA